MKRGESSFLACSNGLKIGRDAALRFEAQGLLLSALGADQVPNRHPTSMGAWVIFFR